MSTKPTIRKPSKGPKAAAGAAITAEVIANLTAVGRRLIALEKTVEELKRERSA